MASVMSFPTRILHGRGAIRELPAELKRVGATRPLLVTDKGILQAGLLRFVAPLLEQAGIKTQVFSDFSPNPTDADALRGFRSCPFTVGCCPGLAQRVLRRARRHRRSRRRALVP